LSFEPNAEASAVSSVVRVSIAGARLSAGSVGLFQGELSSYYLARVKSGDLPAALAARQIPVVSWRANGALVLTPVRPLAESEYSLAGNAGSIGQFTVTTVAPLLSRLWPPAASPGGLAHVIYCGDGSAELSFETLAFEPGDLKLTPLPGVDDTGLFADRCLHFSADAQLGAEQIVVPPPVLGTYALDPAPFSGAPAETATALACSGAQVALGFGCAAVEDDRVLMSTPDAALFWVVHTEHGSVVEVTQNNGSFVLRGLSPGSNERVWGSAYDASGAELAFDSVLMMSGARERLVLNEALANPLGPEPQSEWIELVNDGVIPIDLSRFQLRDGGGSMPLPGAELAPHEYVLLTREDFAPSTSDVPPAPGARVLRVTQLGTSGLSNSGESLALLDADSNVISTLPALAAKAGESLARRHTYSPDDDPNAFSTGTPTPGAPND
jgi:Lamin Tail Domain